MLSKKTFLMIYPRNTQDINLLVNQALINEN